MRTKPIDLLRHFDRDNEPDYVIYRLKSTERDTLLAKLPVEFRDCYISDQSLTDLAGKMQISKSEFLEKYCLPDIPNLISGDFGEILSFFLVVENFQPTVL